MSDWAIEAEELHYSYGKNEAVRGLSFTVGKGEIVSFLGPNGAGKTTTVKMMTGQLKPKGGSVSVLGYDAARKSDRIQEKIGICFETTNLYEKMSAVENLDLFARLFGIRRFDAMPLLARVGLDQRAGDRVASFSKGMKQRLMIARALVSSPELLFLDEPTAGLDPASAQAIRAIVLEEKERGATILLTTHDMVEADKLSDRVAFMNSGEIVAMDTPHNLKQKYGSRRIRAEVKNRDGSLEEREVILDSSETADSVYSLFRDENVITIHSLEASLEDIFIQLTGRGLTG